MAEKRSALVVATSEYADARLAPLAGPGRDAEALEKVLGDTEIGGFEVQLALNAPLAELRTTLDSFFAHNRWIVAGLLGIIPGLLLVGLGGELVFVVLMVVGFLAAEALAGRAASAAAR